MYHHVLATEALRRGLKGNAALCQNSYQQIEEGVNPERRNGLNNADSERLCCVLLGSHRRAMGAGRTTQPVLGWCFYMSYRCSAYSKAGIGRKLQALKPRALSIRQVSCCESLIAAADFFVPGLWSQCSFEVNVLLKSMIETDNGIHFSSLLENV